MDFDGEQWAQVAIEGFGGKRNDAGRTRGGRKEPSRWEYEGRDQIGIDFECSAMTVAMALKAAKGRSLLETCDFDRNESSDATARAKRVWWSSSS